MMYVPGQNAHEEMVSIVDHYKKRIAELERDNNRQAESLATMNDVNTKLHAQLAEAEADAKRLRLALKRMNERLRKDAAMEDE